MKKLIRFGLIILCGTLAALLLSGCRTEQYSDTEKKKLEAKGSSMIEAFLAQNLPASGLISAEAFTIFLPGQPSREFLTEYVTGEYTDNDGVWQYYLNTVTGEAYTAKYFEEAARQAALIQLGLPQEGAEFLAFNAYGLELPHADDEKMRIVEDFNWAVRAMPFGVTDGQSFMALTSGPELLLMECDVAVPEQTDLSVYSYDSVFSEQNRVRFERISVKSPGGWFAAARKIQARYVLLEELELEDCILECTVYHRREAPDETGRASIQQESRLSLSDVSLQRTGDGYLLHFPAVQDPYFYVGIRAREGMAMLDHTYTLRYADDDTPVETEWKEQADGSWLLSFGNSTCLYMKHGGAALTILADRTADDRQISAEA